MNCKIDLDIIVWFCMWLYQLCFSFVIGRFLLDNRYYVCFINYLLYCNDVFVCNKDNATVTYLDEKHL